MLRRWGTRAGLAAALTGGIFWGTALFVAEEVEQAARAGQSSAAEIATLGSILNSFGVAVWPNFGSDPFTCDSTSQGAYYFNTGASTFRTCNGTLWSAGGGGVGGLDDLSDVILTAPSNNEALIFDGADWVNAAQGAAAINDHSDAAVAAPSDGDILQYDGITDNRWENVAGAAPTTLAGHTDTIITAPTDRQVLRFDGADWLNEDEHQEAAYYLFPVYDATGFSNTANAVIGADNQVKIFCWNFPQPINIDRIIWGADTVSGTGCDNGSVGIYSQDGTTLLVDSTAQLYDTNDALVISDIANVYLEAGTYLIAYTATETVSCTVLADDPPAGTNDGYEDLYEELANGSTTECAMPGTAANPSAGGSLPASTGTVTWNGGIFRPIIMFEGTDPP